MIIRKNMTPEDVQKRVASMSKFKRDFNKMVSKNNPNNIPDMDLNKKIQALKSVNRLK